MCVCVCVGVGVGVGVCVRVKREEKRPGGSCCRILVNFN